MDIENIENKITIKLNTIKDHKTLYQVLVDEPVETVLDVARKNEVQNIFTLPFYTGSVEDVPDFSSIMVSERICDSMDEYEVREYIDSLTFSKERLYHLAHPLYVGNLTPVDKAIEGVCRIYFGEDREEVVN